jgi:hypothetical protein
MSILVLTPGGAQLDSILGKIHPGRLALLETFFFIAVSCDMAVCELVWKQSRSDLRLLSVSRDLL